MLSYTKIIICYIICHTRGIAKKENDVVRKKKRDSDATTIKPNVATKIPLLDIERENRLSKIISLYSKGLNQTHNSLLISTSVCFITSCCQ